MRRRPAPIWFWKQKRLAKKTMEQLDELIKLRVEQEQRIADAIKGARTIPGQEAIIDPRTGQIAGWQISDWTATQYTQCNSQRWYGPGCSEQTQCSYPPGHHGRHQAFIEGKGVVRWDEEQAMGGPKEYEDFGINFPLTYDPPKARGKSKAAREVFGHGR